jgi:ATP-dependent DNA helicase RecG
VLIATSLIEVGIDVPNATVMTIEHADRFGLAQLHQLRGRVGRGVFPGYVCLFTTSSEPRVVERLRRFVETRDGFEVAELDLNIRGPGELLGTRQHGVVPFRVADLLRDAELRELARGDVRKALEADPQLASESWSPLRVAIERRFAALHELE